MYRGAVVPVWSSALQSCVSGGDSDLSQETRGAAGTSPEVFALLFHGVSTPVELKDGAVNVKD